MIDKNIRWSQNNWHNFIGGLIWQTLQFVIGSSQIAHRSLTMIFIFYSNIKEAVLVAVIDRLSSTYDKIRETVSDTFTTNTCGQSQEDKSRTEKQNLYDYGLWLLKFSTKMFASVLNW